MVAITTFPRSTAAPARRSPAPRPALRLVAGSVPAPRWSARLLALAGALVVVVAALYLVQAGPTAAPGQVPASDATHVVEAGDTMWSVAMEVAPAGEAATYVERLVELNGTSVVEPGDVLALPLP